jgi:hypothetical protein
LTQSFSTEGRAPSRHSAAPFLVVAAGAEVELGDGFGLGLDIAAETHFIRLQKSDHDPERTVVAFSLRPALWLAKRF